MRLINFPIFHPIVEAHALLIPVKLLSCAILYTFNLREEEENELTVQA